MTSGISGDLISQLPANDTGTLALAAALQHGFLAVLVFAVIGTGGGLLPSRCACDSQFEWQRILAKSCFVRSSARAYYDDGRW